jgi:hypothetical protein
MLNTYHYLALRVLHIIMMVCLLLGITKGNETDCFAHDNDQQYSKDYKAFPPGSPEAVVTNFIEFADLGKDANRQADERYPLFWSLTEQSSVPDNSQSLIIKSYKITGNNSLPSGDVIVNLKMDVRAIAITSCKNNDDYYNKQVNYCNWRERIINIRDITTNTVNYNNTANTQQFINYVFSETKTADDIIAKISGIYAVPKNKRDWIFDIKLLWKKDKYLISTDSIPLEAKYIYDEINSYKIDIYYLNAMNEVCNGKRKLDRSIVQDYDFRIIGLDLLKYKAKYCSHNKIEKRGDAINDLSNILQSLEKASGD